MTMLVMLALFQLKHFVCDWVIQTDQQIRHKGRYMDLTGVTHSIDHAILTVAVILPFSSRWAFTAGLVDGIIHYHVDWLKQNLCFQWSLNPGDKKFWVLMGADQLLHQLTYLALVFLIFAHPL